MLKGIKVKKIGTAYRDEAKWVPVNGKVFREAGDCLVKLIMKNCSIFSKAIAILVNIRYT